jgi:fibronectin-binding autotransporter adhesin
MRVSSPRPSPRWLLLLTVLLGLSTPLFAQLQYQMRLNDGGNQSTRTLNVGDTITLSVYAVVSGTDGIANEALQFSYGSILNTTAGSLKGNLGTFQLNGDPLMGTGFAANGSSAGTGFTDGSGHVMSIGPSSGTTPSSDYIQARASSFQSDQTIGTRVGQNTEFLLGTVTFTVDAATLSASTTSSSFNFLAPTFVSLQRNSLFKSDDVVKNELNGTVTTSATGITFTTGDSTVYWNGGQGSGGQTSTWNTDLLGQTNFSDVNGVNKGTLPGLATEVIFQATTATNPSTTLGRDFSIRKLTFDSTTATPVSISGNKLTIGAGGIEAQAGTGSHTINSNVGLGANQTWNINSAGPLTVTGVVSGAGSLTKAGTGTVILSGAAPNTHTGATVITNGRLEARKTGALGSTASIAVNGGTLLLGDTGGTSRRLNTAANVTLGGGTLASERASLAANTITESVGTLTLTANSTLDFGALDGKGGNTSLTFSGATADWTGILTILNWQGDGYPNNTLPTSDHLIFSDTANVSTQLAQIQFVVGGDVVGARLLDNGEVVAAIPEPTTVAGAVLLVGLIGWRERRRLRTLASKAMGRLDLRPTVLS